MRQATVLTFVLLASGSLVAACGGGAATVTSTKPLQTPVAAQATSTETVGSATAVATATGSVTTPASPGSQTGHGGTVAPRTASAPAYVHEPSPTGELGSAVAEVQAAGYTPDDDAEYHSSQTLRVLVGTHAISSKTSNQRAFFFIGSRYVGTDAREPSGHVSVVSQGETEVTLAYTLYRDGTPSGSADVTFRLDNGFLIAVQQIPPVSSRL